MHVRLRRDSLTSDSDANTEYSCAVEDIKLEPSWDQNDVIPLDNLTTSRQVTVSNNRWPSQRIQNNRGHTSFQMLQSVVPLPEQRPELLKQATSIEEGKQNDANDESTTSPSVIVVGDIGTISHFQNEPAIRKSRKDELHTEISATETESVPQTTITRKDVAEVAKTQYGNRSLGNPSKRFFAPVRQLGTVGKPGEKVLAAFKVRQKLQEPHERPVETDSSGPQSEPDSASAENVSRQGESEGSAMEEANERWEVIDNNDGEWQILEKPVRPEKQPTECKESSLKDQIASQNSNVKPKQKRPVGRPRKFPVTPEPDATNRDVTSADSQTKEILDAGFNTMVKPKRPVGRPRKYPFRPPSQKYEDTTQIFQQQETPGSGEANVSGDVIHKRPVGRPRKSPVTTGGDNNFVSERSARTAGIGQWQEDTSRPTRGDDTINEKRFDGRKRKRSRGRPRKHPISEVQSHIAQNQTSTLTERGEIHDNHFDNEVFSEIKPKRQVGRPRKEPITPSFQYGVFGQANGKEIQGSGTEAGEMLMDWNTQFNQELGLNVDQQQENVNLHFPDEHIGFQRSRRGRPSLLSDIDESTKAEIIRYCLKYGTSKTAETFTQKLGKMVSNQTVWRLMKTYLDGNGFGDTEQITRKSEPVGEPRLTPEQQKQVAKYAIKYGTTEATDYFSRIFGRPIGRDTIARLKQRYQQLRDWTTEISMHEDDSQEVSGKRKQYRSKYSRELKNQIAEYSIKYGNSAAAFHFSRLLNTKVPVNTVLALKYIYRKERGVADKRPRLHRGPNYPSENIPENGNYFPTTMEPTSSDNYPSVGPARRRVYNKYTQTQRKQMAEFSSKYGVDAAVQHFSQLLGTDVPAATIAYIRSKYNKRKRELALEKAVEMSYAECPDEDDEYEERGGKPMTKYNLRKAQAEMFYGEIDATPTHDDYADVEPDKFVAAENWKYERQYNNVHEFTDIDSENEMGSDEYLPHI